MHKLLRETYKKKVGRSLVCTFTRPHHAPRSQPASLDLASSYRPRATASDAAAHISSEDLTEEKKTRLGPAVVHITSHTHRTELHASKAQKISGVQLHFAPPLPPSNTEQLLLMLLGKIYFGYVWEVGGGRRQCFLFPHIGRVFFMLLCAVICFAIPMLMLVLTGCYVGDDDVVYCLIYWWYNMVRWLMWRLMMMMMATRRRTIYAQREMWCEIWSFCVCVIRTRMQDKRKKNEIIRRRCKLGEEVLRCAKMNVNVWWCAFITFTLLYEWIIFMLKIPCFYVLCYKVFFFFCHKITSSYLVSV